MIEDNTVYRDRYRQTLKQLVVMLIVAIALAASLIYILMIPEKVRNYATRTTGEVITLHALNEPIITQKHLLQWAQIATRTAFNIDFANYQQQLEGSKHFFTPAAWKQFQKALDKNGLLKAVIDKKLVMQAVVSGSANVVAEGVYQGRYMWKVQMPLLVNYSSASTQLKTNLVVTMTITRVRDLDVPGGIQINAFSAQQGTLNQLVMGGS